MENESKPFTFQNILSVVSKLANLCVMTSLPKIYNNSEISPLKRQSSQNFSDLLLRYFITLYHFSSFLSLGGVVHLYNVYFTLIQILKFGKMPLTLKYL